MKKLVLLAALAVFSISCSDDDDNGGSGLSNNPEARAEFDDSSGGIYKGVFVGSSGVVYVNIANEGEISARMVIDGDTYNFTTDETATPGEDISGLTFTNDDMSFDFSVDSNGDFPSVTNIDFPAHPNATVVVVKEYSDSLVECFQGTFSGDDSGVFNFIIQDNFLEGIAESNDNDEIFTLSGVVLQGSINGAFSNGSFTGDVDGDDVSGSWENDLNEDGNWTGRRKL